MSNDKKNTNDDNKTPKAVPGAADPLERLGTGIKNISGYVAQHAPALGKRTWLQGLLAYRRGAQALSTNALSASGVDLKSGLVSISLTVALFVATNLLLSLWVSYVFSNYKPAFLDDVGTLSETRIALKREGWDNSDKNMDVIQRLGDNSGLELPLHRWIELEFVTPDTDDSGVAARKFRSLAIGSATSGLILRSPEITTASEILARLQESSDTNTRLRAESQNPSRKHFCLAMLNDLLKAIERPVRLQLALNGLIQFLTIFVGLFVLTAVFRRWLFVTKLASNWLGENFKSTLAKSDGTNSNDREIRTLVARLGRSDDIDVESLIRSELDRLSRDTTKEIYESYWFIAGIMPSLGFIGTVVGMSASLMLANELFVATDKQLAIGKMTRELGLAFDTTFVALVFGLIAGLPIAYVNSRERTFFRELATCITDMKHRKTGAEVHRVATK